MSTEICPICNEPQLLSTEPSVFECQYCKARIVNGRLICPACKRANELGLEHCHVCGEPLTVVGAVISRQVAGYGSQRLEQIKVQAGEIKAQAERHSQVRMSAFNDVDQRRKQSERDDAARQKVRDHEILKYTAIGSGIFLLIVAIISLIIIL
jgi:hypothetical protein